MSRLTRDGTAEPVSRDQILRHVRGQGNIHFSCSADYEQDWQPYPIDTYSAICDEIHTYIHERKQRSRRRETLTARTCKISTVHASSSRIIFQITPIGCRAANMCVSSLKTPIRFHRKMTANEIIFTESRTYRIMYVCMVVWINRVLHVVS